MKLSYTTYKTDGEVLNIKFSGPFPQKFRNKLKEIDFVYSRSTMCWSGRKYHNKAIEIAEEICSYDFDAPDYNPKYKDTLCWVCKNSVLASNAPCSWVSKFEPVDGWNAVPTYDKKTVSNLTKDPSSPQSYLVISCPLFDPD